MAKHLPENITEIDLPRFDAKNAREIPPHEIKEVSDVFFNSDNIIFRGGKILPASFVNGTLGYFFASPHGPLTILKKYLGFKNFLSDPFLLVSRFLRKKIVLSETCLCFTDTWSLGYFHWFSDALPRLLTAEKYLNQAVIILPATYRKKDYVTESLKIFGAKNIRWVEKDEVLAIKKLIIPNHVAPSGNYDQKVTDELIKKLNGFQLNGQEPDLGDKIYLSREKAGKRKIENESEILPILSRYGFKKVILENYKWGDQISICRNAKYLIGNHGAGLTNLIFMTAGSKILELGGENNPFFLYFSLAQAAKIRYYYQICRYTPSISKKTNRKNNIIVDIKKLEENINLMLS